jgi:hypothetical protein
VHGEHPLDALRALVEELLMGSTEHAPEPILAPQVHDLGVGLGGFVAREGSTKAS